MSYPLAPATAPTTAPDEIGTELGEGVAALIIANMHAMEDGWEHGYAAERHLSACCPLPETLAYIPAHYARVPLLADRYQASYTEGRAAYRADQADQPDQPTSPQAA